MASAFVSAPSIWGVNGSIVTLGCDTTYAGPDVLNVLRITHLVNIDPELDTPATIRSKITDEVVAWAVTQVIIVNRVDVILPEFQKGS